MSRPTQILRHEHRVIEQALRALDGMCLNMKMGGNVPPEALYQILDFISRREWVTATAIGAFVAWAIGMAPSMLMALNQSAGSAPPPEMSDAVKYAFASVMGAALGTILGAPQWRALRRYASGASLWVWANAAAWAVGMPMVFIGAGASPAGSSAPMIALTVVVTIAAAGASVGAIHGVALLWLLRQRQEEASPAIEDAWLTSSRPPQRVK
jgi:Uncharacterized conserved protein